jgi:twitching motility protein PilT
MDFDGFLDTAIARGASDVHLKANAHPVLRVHGHLEVHDDLKVLTREEIDALARQLVGDRRYTLLREGKEVDFAHTRPGKGRFRVNLFLAKGDIRMVLRVIPNKIPRFEELHLPPVLEKLAMERRGLVLVTGITGSGKSTTLAAMIDYMNRYRNDHIITIEDPIEFAHEDKKCVVSQREIGSDSVAFGTALRAALRQDPDVILVGEMRDAETMEVALHAAETGHLVLSTLHTLNATETVNRIIGTFPPHQEDQIRMQLAAVMQGIISQRLIVRADVEGRVPAVEVMVGTGIIRDSIREANRTMQIPSIMAAGMSQYGMQTFDQSLLGLYRQGMITYETAREAASNPDDFDLKVKGVFSASEMTFETAPKAGEEPAGPVDAGGAAAKAPAPAQAGRPEPASASSFFRRP